MTMTTQSYDVNKLIELWNLKASASEIGKELGITRNAVIGKVKRLREKGVPLRSFVAKPKEERTRVRVREVKTDRGWVKKKEVVKIEPVQLDFDFLPPLPERNIDILKLTPFSCRYIVDHDQHRGAIYCGEAKQGRSYCGEHTRICYIPLKKDQGAHAP